MTKPKIFKIKRCVLNCQNEDRLFSFPDQADASKLWLKVLGLEGTPLCRYEMYVCLNHFSSRQLSDNGRTITPTAIPDKNIPGKENPPESEIKVVQNPKKNLYSSLTSNPRPRNIVQSVMLTSESSKCYLKCKTYRSLHRFPSDLTSFNVWIQKLGLPETVKLNRTASLCDNHFSPAMRTSKKLSRCAVPDNYLPLQCTFIDEFEALPEESPEARFNENDVSNGSLPIINYDFSHIKITGKSTTAKIVTNPITKNSVYSTATNDGSLLQHSDTSDIICPENYKNALFECVLKCPNSKTLYRFPNVESRRQLWLSKIGLTHCFCNTRICSRHFSEKMLSKQRLTNSAYPDINLPELEQPRIRVASLPLEDPTRLEVQEIPQYICVLTVVTNNKKINSLINKTKYVKYTVDKTIPMRERGVQVDDLVDKVNVGILADEDFSDEETFENTNFEQQPDLITTMFQSQIFPSKTKDMFECLKCGEISLDKESNRRHLNLHCRDLSRLCFLCGRRFTSEIKLKIHEMKVHSLGIKKLERCPKKNCKKAFHSRKRLDQHLDEHVRPAKHFCVNCGRLFFSSLKLSCHLLACRRMRKSKCRYK